MPTARINNSRQPAPTVEALECGLLHDDLSPRSQGNAFNWKRPAPAPVVLTKKDQERAYQRDYHKRAYVTSADKKARLLAFSPSNSHNFGGAKDADGHDRTAKIRGVSSVFRSGQ